MDFRLPLRSDYDRNAGEKWDSCFLCGARLYRALVHFDSGSVAPTEGEAVTGATSGDTGVVDRYVLISGTFGGGDAVGVMEFTSPTGYDQVLLEIFQDNEALNGGTSGNDFATVNGVGAVQVSGRLHPVSELVEYRGRLWCRPHFKFRHAHEWEDEADVDANENDRGV